MSLPTPYLTPFIWRSQPPKIVYTNAALYISIYWPMKYMSNLRSFGVAIYIGGVVAFSFICECLTGKCRLKELQYIIRIRFSSSLEIHAYLYQK